MSETQRLDIAPLVTQSLQEIAKLPLAERGKIIAPYLSATAEDFANDPAMTAFSVLDSEDWGYQF
jgi:hypothetical protein